MPTMQSLEARLAALDAPRVRQPVAKSTAEQMAAARAAAYATVRHDGLEPGYRMVAGEPWCFGTSATSDDIEAELASRALGVAA